MLQWLRKVFKRDVDFTSFVKKIEVLDVKPGSIIYIELDDGVPEDVIKDLRVIWQGLVPSGAKAVVQSGKGVKLRVAA